LNVRTIQRIEKGQEPSVESLKSLAAVFNVDFSTQQAVEAGELDAQIEAAALKLREGFVK
jgi:transcriptional regulator with XRE-family HTH domain